MVFGRKKDDEDPWQVNELLDNEEVLYIIAGTYHYHKKNMSDKETNEAKRILHNTKSEFFKVLTNQRVASVNFKTKDVIYSLNLSDVDIVGEGRLITFVKGTDEVWEWELFNGDKIIAMMNKIKEEERDHTLQTSPKLENTIQMGSNSQPSEDPLKILKLRFVKGEITKEQFEEMKSAIE